MGVKLDILELDFVLLFVYKKRNQLTVQYQNSQHVKLSENPKRHIIFRTIDS